MEQSKWSNPLFTLSIGEFIDLMWQTNRESVKGLIEELLPKPKKEEKELMDINGAAELLMLSKSTIYQRLNKIPHIKKGKRLIFKRSVLLNWLEEGVVKTDEELRRDAAESLRYLVTRRRRK